MEAERVGRERAMSGMDMGRDGAVVILQDMEVAWKVRSAQSHPPHSTSCKEMRHKGFITICMHTLKRPYFH